MRDLFELAESYYGEGFCIECNEWARSGCEPDARNYPCPLCGKNSVFSFDELIIMDHPQIDDIIADM